MGRVTVNANRRIVANEKGHMFLTGWNDWLKRSPDFKDGKKRVKANTKDGEKRVKANAKDGKKRAISELLISRCESYLSKLFEKEYWTKHPVTETGKGSASATNVHMAGMFWKTFC